MIIYDTNFNFLGVSSNILLLLGYSDMSNFLETNSDVADLFIKKPGFIHKFNNFSWISYILNGATPNKVVSLRLKNGNELQATVKITEIELKTTDEKLYSVELQNTVVITTGEINMEPEKKESVFKMFEDDTNLNIDNNINSIDIDDGTSSIFNMNNDDNFEIKSLELDEDNEDEIENIKKESDNLDNSIEEISLNDDIFKKNLPDETHNDFTINFEDNSSYPLNQKNQIDVKIEENVDNSSLDNDTDSDFINEYFDDYSAFASEEFSKLYKYIDSEDNELLNAEIVKFIGASNILKFDDIAQKLLKAKLADTFDEKKQIIDDIKSNIINLTNKLKG